MAVLIEREALKRQIKILKVRSLNSSTLLEGPKKGTNALSNPQLMIGDLNQCETYRWMVVCIYHPNYPYVPIKA